MDFTKMVDAYRWRGGDSSTKKHGYFCSCLCASPALATPCNNEEEEEAHGSSIVSCTYKSSSSLLHISSSYKPGRKHLLKKKRSKLATSIKLAASKAKRSAYFTTSTVKALGQRDIVHKTWIPPISEHALIQEELYQDPWKVLVACMLLNRTSGTQMRKVIWDLFALCPTPEAAVAVDTDKIEQVIRHLGLQKKRARMIQKFSNDYLGKEWLNVGELHGIGEYATDAYAIFCEGRWREAKPRDHKLFDYWRYMCHKWPWICFQERQREGS